MGRGPPRALAPQGSVETCLDEATAELVKITKAAVAATSEIRFKIVKPIPLHRSLRVSPRRRLGRDSAPFFRRAVLC